MPRSQPRNSNSISLGRSSRHQYIWKNPQGDSSRRPRGIIRGQFSPWYCQMRGELWARVFLHPSCLFLWRADPEIQHSDPKQEQNPPGSSLGPVSNKLRDLVANSSLGSLCCGLRLTESSFQEKRASRGRIHLWALMPRCSRCAEDSLTSSRRKRWRQLGLINFWYCWEVLPQLGDSQLPSLPSQGPKSRMVLWERGWRKQEDTHYPPHGKQASWGGQVPGGH